MIDADEIFPFKYASNDDVHCNRGQITDNKNKIHISLGEKRPQTSGATNKQAPSKVGRTDSKEAKTLSQ